MIPQPPPGQGPVDPRGAFSPPPPGSMPPGPPPHGMAPPMFPPMMMPPMPPYYPLPRGGGFAKAILVTLATSIFGFSILANIYLLLFSGLMSGGSTNGDTIVDGDSSQQVAVLPIEGEITQATFDQADKSLRTIEKDSNVKALVIRIDTPGGEVGPSDEIYHRLMKLKTDKKIPVIISMGGMATSGGYYIACSGDYIFAEPTTLTGNIGVVLQRFNFSDLMDKYGVKDTSITPVGAKYKYAESPFRPETPEARAYLAGIAEDIYGQFKTVVQTSRGSALKAPMDRIADGRANPANEALQLGLVDKIGFAHDAYDYAASKAAIPAGKMEVVNYKPHSSFVDALMGSSKFGGGTGSVNFSVDRKTIDDLTTPRMLYLWRGE